MNASSRQPPPPSRFVTVEHGAVSFEVPESWIEDSAVTVARPGAAPRPALSLNRMTAAPDETLETTIARRLTPSKVAVDVSAVGAAAR